MGVQTLELFRGTFDGSELRNKRKVLGYSTVHCWPGLRVIDVCLNEKKKKNILKEEFTHNSVRLRVEKNQK